MKNKFLLIIFLLFSCSNKSVKDELVCIQLVDRNGFNETINSEDKLKKFAETDFNSNQPYEKVLRIYKKVKSINIFSKLTSYHQNGNIYKYLEIKDGRAFGKYFEYFPNGNMKIESIVLSGSADFSNQTDWVFNGQSKVYAENQNLLIIFNYSNGSLENETKYFYPNKVLKTIVPYKSNELNGEVIKFSEKGEVLEKTNYLDGKKHGASIGYYSKDNIAFLEEYERDNLISGQYFKKNRLKVSQVKNSEGLKAIFKDNKITQLIEYKNGKVNGKVKNFEEDELISEYVIQNDKKNGEEIIYYNFKETRTKEKKPKLLISWDNDSIHGLVKTWYKSGSLESQKEYSLSKKNGEHFAWYKNGSVMFIEEYENDLLINGSYYQIDKKELISSVSNGEGVASLYDSDGRFLKKVKYKDGKPIE